MNYDLKKAVDRFQFRFTKENGSFKTFKPNEDDVSAINLIFGWIGRQKKENVLNNVLFAKLYIYHKTMNIRFYETTVLNNKYNVVDSDLINLFKTPLYLFYESFHRDLHDNQLNRLVTIEDKEQQTEIWKQYLELRKSFTLEIVSSKLQDEISEVLNKFSDYKKTDFKPSDFGK